MVRVDHKFNNSWIYYSDGIRRLLDTHSPRGLLDLWSRLCCPWVLYDRILLHVPLHLSIVIRSPIRNMREN